MKVEIRLTFYKNLCTLQKVFLYISVTCFIIASVMIYTFIEYKRGVTSQTEKNVQQETRKAATKFDETFYKIMGIADEIAGELSRGELKKQDIRSRLETSLNSRNKFFGIGVAYIPYLNDPYVRTKSPYYVSVDSVENLEKGELVKVYSTPIYHYDTITNAKVLLGTVFVDFLLSELKDVMSNLSLGQSGYGFILSQDGTFIAHPIAEFNLSEFDNEEKTIFQVSDDMEDKQLQILGQFTVIEKKAGVLEHINTLTGQDSWMFYQPIESIGWSLVVVFIKEDLPINVIYLRNMLIWISLFLMFCCVSTFGIITRVHSAKTRNLWIFVIMTSLSLLCQIGYIWYLAMKYDIENNDSYVKIVDRTGVDNFINSYYKQIKHLCPEPPMLIPTGIYVKAIEFPNASNVFLSGYIWQKYSNEVLNKLDTLGAFFPEAIDDDYFLSYTTKSDDYTVYGWYFRVTIQKKFDYSRYPLDKKNLLVQISPIDFAKNIVLTPDLSAYKFLNPNLLPGLADHLSLRGWETMYSNFVYEQNDYSLDFGINEFNCKERAPILYFDINFRRDFVGTIVSKSIPIVVMLFIMFVLLTITTKNIEYVTRILGLTGSFFFALIYAHISTRTDLAVKGFVYYEYFFITIYVMILLGFLDSVFFYQNHTFKKNRFFFDYKNNLISKLAFWPLFLTIFLTITIYYLMIK